MKLTPHNAACVETFLDANRLPALLRPGGANTCGKTRVMFAELIHYIFKDRVAAEAFLVEVDELWLA